MSPGNISPFFYLGYKPSSERVFDIRRGADDDAGVGKNCS